MNERSPEDITASNVTIQLEKAGVTVAGDIITPGIIPEQTGVLIVDDEKKNGNTKIVIAAIALAAVAWSAFKK